MQDLNTDELAKISTNSSGTLFTIEDAFNKLDINDDGEVDNNEVQ